MSISDRYPLLLRPVAMGRDRADYGAASEPHHHQPARRSRKSLMAASLLIIAIVWLYHANTGSSPNATLNRNADSQQHTTTQFDWSTLETKTHLHYAPCYESLQCARLELPMDWFNETTNATISLAVVRQPAVVHSPSIRRCHPPQPGRTRWLWC